MVDDERFESTFTAESEKALEKRGHRSSLQGVLSTVFGVAIVIRLIANLKRLSLTLDSVHQDLVDEECLESNFVMASEERVDIGAACFLNELPNRVLSNLTSQLTKFCYWSTLRE